jgi:hypothetical protein
MTSYLDEAKTSRQYVTAETATQAFALVSIAESLERIADAYQRPAEILADDEPPELTPEQLSKLRPGSIVLDDGAAAWELDAKRLWRRSTVNGRVPQHGHPWAHLITHFGPIRLVYAAP